MVVNATSCSACWAWLVRRLSSYQCICIDIQLLDVSKTSEFEIDDLKSLPSGTQLFVRIKMQTVTFGHNLQGFLCTSPIVMEIVSPIP